MSNKTLWVNRKFAFNFSVESYTEILARLEKTPGRLEELVKNISEKDLKHKPGGKWSIQEHIGHLVSTEALFLGRLDDFEAEAEILRPADMTNLRTNKADYNSVEIGSILEAFNFERGKLLSRLKAYEPEMFACTALHPRLNKPMRLVDSIYFEAEHDDHHLQTISELVFL